jgi:hypothetical protein
MKMKFEFGVPFLELTDEEVQAPRSLSLPPRTFFLTVDHDRIRIEFGMARGGEKSRIITSGDDLRQFLGSKANEFGVSVRDLKVMVSSSLDFPEDATEDAATIALAHEIRDPDWEVFLGPTRSDTSIVGGSGTARSDDECG